MKSRLHFLLPVIVLILAILTGCATMRPAAEPRDSYSTVLPAGTAPVLDPMPDPLEGYNRFVHAFNGKVVKYAALPLSRFWNSVLPVPLRRGMKNFSSNLRYPLHLVSALLQGKWHNGWEETERFAINSTVGLLGIMDPATAWGFEPHQDGFPEVLTAYGFGTGCFFNIPFAGPSCVRDTAGLILNLPFNILTWILPDGAGTGLTAAIGFNTVSDEMPLFDQVFTCNYDSYLLAKAYYGIKTDSRQSRPVMYEGSSPRPDDTLNVLSAHTQRPDFYHEARNRRAVLDKTHSMPYSCWPVSGSDRLVVILPGLGAHRLSGTVIYLAELLNTHGISVITLSPTLAPDYFLNLPDLIPPGNFPEDTPRLANVLKCVVDDFKAEYGMPGETPITLAGYSLGGANALFLASLKEQNLLPDGLDITRFIAINPPVDALHALQKIDDYFDIPATWPEDEQEARTRNLFLKLAAPLTGTKDTPFLPPTEDESRFLIGLSMRHALGEAILAMDEHSGERRLLPEAPDASRNRLWQEAFKTSAMDYVNQYVVPYYTKENGEKANAILERAGDLRAIADTLACRSDIRVIHCANDFLLKPGDIFWLQATFSKNLVLFPAGGHLGELPTEAFKNIFVHFVEK